MKKNGKIALSAGLILLLSGYIVLRDRSCGGGLPSSGSWKEEPTEIIIQKPSETIVLKLKDGIWTVGEQGYAADAGEVANMIGMVKGLEIADRVSSAGHYATYDLTPDRAVAVILRGAGGEIRKLLIGKKSSTQRHTYMRVNDSNDVLLVTGIFDHEFNKSVNDLRDRTVINVDRDQVDRVEITVRGRTLVFTRQKPAPSPEKKGPDAPQAPDQQAGAPARWVCRGYETRQVDPARMDSLLASVSPFKASGFVDGDKNLLKNPVCTVKIVTAGGESIVYIHQADKDKRYTVTSASSPYLFLVEEWKVSRFMKGAPEDFFVK